MIPIQSSLSPENRVANEQGYASVYARAEHTYRKASLRPVFIEFLAFSR